MRGDRPLHVGDHEVLEPEPARGGSGGARATVEYGDRNDAEVEQLRALALQADELWIVGGEDEQHRSLGQ